ncbi:S-adenosyl-L-methionine-dependent methyltransferase [Armillaria borealis]|uniref:rRNA adenine N(6)-methyltransferase n=1 Tax=Armillaria borealis TaxID=47425 RepID=A0AA39J7E6_9AGAR|nr:S-adenosyl-L-methionine-dependent methyltransferase [Armillaria borealis]
MPLFPPCRRQISALYSWAPRRYYRTKKVKIEKPENFIDLPDYLQWRSFFPSNPSLAHRISVANPETAKKIANAFVPEGSKDKVIIEAYPGPGQLTRALLALPKERVKKLIVLETHDSYLQYLRSLEAIDDRVKVLDLPAVSWSTYDTVEEMGLLKDVETLPWEAGVHPNLHYISHLRATISGEQFIAQQFRTIPDRQWLFKFGRVPMSHVMSEYVWQRVSGPLGDRLRCKLSVIAEATAKCEEALPFSETQPLEHHFHPAPSEAVMTKVGELRQTKKMIKGRRLGMPFQVINMVPRADVLIFPETLDKWDYCLRRMFVQKATPFKKALLMLGPGAGTLAKTLCNPENPVYIDPDSKIHSLTTEQWQVVVQAFHEWPFAPQVSDTPHQFHLSADRNIPRISA